MIQDKTRHGPSLCRRQCGRSIREWVLSFFFFLLDFFNYILPSASGSWGGGWGLRGGVVSLMHSALGSLWFLFHNPSDEAARRHSLLLFKLLVSRTDLRNPVYWVPSREVTAEAWRQWEPWSSGEHAGALQCLITDGKELAVKIPVVYRTFS